MNNILIKNLINFIIYVLYTKKTSSIAERSSAKPFPGFRYLNGQNSACFCKLLIHADDKENKSILLDSPPRKIILFCQTHEYTWWNYRFTPPHNIQCRDSWAGIGAKISWVGALAPPVFLTCLEGTWRRLWGLQYSRLSTVKTLLTMEEVHANNTGFLLIIMPTFFPHPQLQPSFEWLIINLEAL